MIECEHTLRVGVRVVAVTSGATSCVLCERDQLKAEIARLRAQAIESAAERDTLVAAMTRLTPDTPHEEQDRVVAVLLAEIRRLKAKCRELALSGPVSETDAGVVLADVLKQRDDARDRVAELQWEVSRWRQNEVERNKRNESPS